MSIKKNILIITSFCVGFVVAIISVFFKISHWPGALALIITGFAGAVIFIIMDIIEISRSVWIRRSEKILWVIFIILLSNLAGLIYLFSARKRIITGQAGAAR